MSLDKYEMYKWLKDHDYKCAKSYMDKDEFYADVEAGKANYPVFVKPARVVQVLRFLKYMIKKQQNYCLLMMKD